MTYAQPPAITRTPGVERLATTALTALCTYLLVVLFLGESIAGVALGLKIALPLLVATWFTLRYGIRGSSPTVSRPRACC